MEATFARSVSEAKECNKMSHLGEGDLIICWLEIPLPGIIEGSWSSGEISPVPPTAGSEEPSPA
ncbi:hypothetical protein N7463_010183 [Penicillium fimorum]|uniref:Uncharacterized protein n=1 Tax=Penicillium fimorum TaxID=1882269 RepID=A0A9X0C163_9EURO|nr:hypothetical protein N7463_010183 [Penicillium fimorum]